MSASTAQLWRMSQDSTYVLVDPKQEEGQRTRLLQTVRLPKPSRGLFGCCDFQDSSKTSKTTTPPSLFEDCCGASNKPRTDVSCPTCVHRVQEPQCTCPPVHVPCPICENQRLAAYQQAACPHAKVCPRHAQLPCTVVPREGSRHVTEEQLAERIADVERREEANKRDREALEKWARERRMEEEECARNERTREARELELKRMAAEKSRELAAEESRERAAEEERLGDLSEIKRQLESVEKQREEELRRLTALEATLRHDVSMRRNVPASPRFVHESTIRSHSPRHCESRHYVEGRACESKRMESRREDSRREDSRREDSRREESKRQESRRCEPNRTVDSDGRGCKGLHRHKIVYGEA